MAQPVREDQLDRFKFPMLCIRALSVVIEKTTSNRNWVFFAKDFLLVLRQPPFKEQTMPRVFLNHKDV